MLDFKEVILVFDSTFYGAIRNPPDTFHKTSTLGWRDTKCKSTFLKINLFSPVAHALAF